VQLLFIGGVTHSKKMRHERRKQYRGYLKFFERTFGVRAPFKVICDGNFLHHFVTHGMGADVKELLRMLATVFETEQIELFVTEAVLRELEDIGAEKTLALAKQLEPLRVGKSLEESRAMDPPLAIKKLVGFINKRRYVVATQDEELRQILRDIPGVPLLFLQRVLVGLEAPSAKSHEFWSKQEQKKLQAGKEERKRLKVLETAAKSEEDASTEQDKGKKNKRSANDDEPTRKRKRTKKSHHPQA